MKVSEIMKKNCICIQSDVSLQAAAELMADNDCGAFPVVENADQRGPLLGVITDRDIVIRSVAKGRNPDEAIKPYVSAKVATLGPDQEVDEALKMMSDRKIRRAPVLDDDGKVLGMLTASHLASHYGGRESGEYFKSVSEKTKEASLV